MLDVLEKKYTDYSWNFEKANTKQHVHCYHMYPAVMIPQIAERLIYLYGKNAKNLFDPYCGTGTSLVEAVLKNINAVGTDLNPLARLITEVKITKIEPKTIDKYIEKLNKFLYSNNKPKISIPVFKNIDFWFSNDVKNKLATIKHFIDYIRNKNIKNFFYVAFSETVRECSFTRNNEFKLYRMPKTKMEQFSPNVFEIIISKLLRNKKGLIEYISKIKNIDATAQVFGFNTVETVENISKNSIDIVVTSPPYGDSKTTVAYGQFSRLANQWLELGNSNQIDNILMGGVANEIQTIGVDIVDKTIDKIAKQDTKRAKDVYSFYKDYHDSINNVSTTLKKGGYVCYVVGNRRVKGIVLPTDEITKKLFEKNNFKHENTFVRNIPNKRMPNKNSPTNKIGKLEATMTSEYIVVMKKN